MLACLCVLIVYVADLVTHLQAMTAMRDLVVYRNGGLIARHVSPLYDARRSSPLYDWTGQHGVHFTYAPFAAVIFAVASVLPWTALRALITIASVAALAASAWLTFGALGYRRDRVRAGAALLVTAVAFCTDPVQDTLVLGQVNLLLMLLIIADLCQRGDPGGQRWWKGAGIGIAAGIKLVPLIFIPYLVLTRRFRQAAVASGTFCATVALGFAVMPRDSTYYWVDRLFLQANRIVFPGTRGNQSLRGIITRFAGSVAGSASPWLVAAAAVAVAGLACAVMLERAGHPVPGMLACALTGLLVSPLSWDHHWVWIVPALVLLADLAVRARGQARAAWWLSAAALAAVFGAWPQFWVSNAALVPSSLISLGPGTYFATGDHPRFREYHWHGLQLIGGNSYVLAGLAGLAVLAVAALRARRAPPLMPHDRG